MGFHLSYNNEPFNIRSSCGPYKHYLFHLAKLPELYCGDALTDEDCDKILKCIVYFLDNKVVCDDTMLPSYDNLQDTACNNPRYLSCTDENIQNIIKLKEWFQAGKNISII